MSEIEKNIMSITINKAASADARLSVDASAQRPATCICGSRNTTAILSAWMPVQCDCVINV